jgi:hypothetical protein
VFPSDLTDNAALPHSPPISGSATFSASVTMLENISNRRTGRETAAPVPHAAR